MKKAIYLVSISVITIINVIIGTIYHTSGVEFGYGFPWGFPWGMWSEDDDVIMDKDYVNVEGAKVTSIKNDDGRITADTVALDAFDSVEMNLRVMDVTVVAGDEAGIRYECSKAKYAPNIIVADGVLVVKQRNDKLGWGSNIKNCKLTLTVPEGTEYKEFAISTDVGDVKLESISGEKLILDADTGDIKVTDCSFERTEISDDTGDIKLLSCKLGASEISGNTGDILLSDCDFGNHLENMNISTDTGDVTVEGCPDLDMFETDFSTDIGEVKVNGEKYKKHYSEDAVLSSSTENNSRFTISTDTGDITVIQRMGK